jgi:hypothetical protein
MYSTRVAVTVFLLRGDHIAGLGSGGGVWSALEADSPLLPPSTIPGATRRRRICTLMKYDEPSSTFCQIEYLAIDIDLRFYVGAAKVISKLRNSETIQVPFRYESFVLQGSQRRIAARTLAFAVRQGLNRNGCCFDTNPSWLQGS